MRIHETGIDEGSDKLTILLVVSAHFCGAQIVRFEAKSKNVCCISWAYLNEPTRPTIREECTAHAHALNVVAVLEIKRRPLADRHVDECRERFAFVVFKRRDIDLSRLVRT